MDFATEDDTYVPLQLAMKTLDSAEALRRLVEKRKKNCDNCRGHGNPSPQQKQSEADESYASDVISLSIRVITVCIFHGQQWWNDNNEGGLIPSTSAFQSYIRGLRLKKITKNQVVEGSYRKSSKFSTAATDDGMMYFRKDLSTPSTVMTPDANNKSCASNSISTFGDGEYGAESILNNTLPQLCPQGNYVFSDLPSTPKFNGKGQSWKAESIEIADEAQALSPSPSNLCALPSLNHSHQDAPQVGHFVLSESSPTRHSLDIGEEENNDDRASESSSSFADGIHKLNAVEMTIDPRTNAHGKKQFSGKPKPKKLEQRSQSTPMSLFKSSANMHGRCGGNSKEEKQKALLVEELSDILLRLCVQLDNLVERKPNYYSGVFHMPHFSSELSMLKGRANTCLDRLIGKALLGEDHLRPSGRNAPMMAEIEGNDTLLSCKSFPPPSHNNKSCYKSPIEEITGRIFWERHCCNGTMSSIPSSFVTWWQFANAFERVYGSQPKPVMERFRRVLESRSEARCLTQRSVSSDSLLYESPSCSSTRSPHMSPSQHSQHSTLQKLKKLCISPSRKRKANIHMSLSSLKAKNRSAREQNMNLPNSATELVAKNSAGEGSSRHPLQRWIFRNGGHGADLMEASEEFCCKNHDTSGSYMDHPGDDADDSRTLVYIETFARFCLDHRGLYEGFVAVTDPGTHIECLGSVEDLSKDELRNLGHLEEEEEQLPSQGQSSGSKFSSSPLVLPDLLGLKILQLSCGGQHAAVLVEGGAVYTWGKGGFGRLGHGDSRPSSSPRQVSIPHKCVQVACGFAYTAAVTSCGQVYAWGAGENGRLGVGDEHDRNVPTKILLRSRTKVRSVYAGSVHTCVLTTDGDVFSFGKHEYTGHGSSNDILVPRKLDAFGKEKISQMSVGPGGYHTIALTEESGNVFTWGHNRVGQLGFSISDSNTNNIEGGYFVPKPTLVKSISGLGVSQVVAGWGHSAVVTKKGHVYTCGRNFQGQLGLGEPDFSTVNERGHPYQSSFHRVEGDLSDVHVTQFACGGEHSVALTSDGQLYAFGKGHKGQLGDTSSETRYLPTLVNRFENCGRQTMQVACGNNCTLVLRGRYTVPSLFDMCKNVILSQKDIDKNDLPPVVSSILHLHDDILHDNNE